ncbi:MAG TPA: nickel pincer cofactor biosynthesis protein LarC [Thermodesulfobacteriota bacterium]|nr:nickel pincer cofactor biosynthesis protein LarC [Thermodesulfobacteriota bacterium]
MKRLYFDCFSGASGDMILGSLIHLGVDLENLRSELSNLPVKGYKISARFVNRSGIKAYKFNVTPGKDKTERNFKEIRSIIQRSKLNDKVRKTAVLIFEKLAEAEAKIHGVKPEEIHFHEVGGIDSIVDVIGTTIGINLLGIEEIYSSAIPFSRSLIKMEHGLYPGPSPAVLELLRGVEMYESERNEELVTPTGAAILKVISKGFGSFPRMRISKIGYGAGTRNSHEYPNVLRAILGEDNINSEGMEKDTVVVIESNIDDMSPEAFDNLFDKLLLLEEALDVSVVNAMMKRGRPGHIVKVISKEGGAQKVTETLFKESTTLGVRYTEANRFKLRRKERIISTRYGDIRVKIVDEPELGIKRAKPEYEDCKSAANRHNVSLQEIYDEVNRVIDR